MAGNLKEKSVGMFYYMMMSDGFRVGFIEQGTVEEVKVDSGEGMQRLEKLLMVVY